MTAQMKTGSGTITRIDKDLPFLEYEFSWTDRTTNEKKSAKCQFMVFSPTFKEEFKNTSLKTGDIVQCEYEQNGWDKVLMKAGPKQVSSGGGWRKPFDPVAAAKKEAFEERKQQMIVRQSSLDRAVELWISTKPANVTCTENDLKTILDVAGKFEMWVMRS